MRRIVFRNLRSDYVATIMGCCGSLVCSGRVALPRLCEALQGADESEVLAAATQLVEMAVPEQGDIHPQRAGVANWGEGIAQFVTPGGVFVTLSLESDGIRLYIDFCRESAFLAGSMLSALCFGRGACTVQVEVDGQVLSAAMALASCMSALDGPPPVARPRPRPAAAVVE